MIKYRKIPIICCLLAFAVISHAQEVLKPLEINPVLKKLKQKQTSTRLKSTTAEPVIIHLPFKDDFSYNSALPDDSLWANQNVFINTTLADTMPSIGIATFDALDNSGNVYKNVNLKTFSADTLTSNPIALSSQMDSLWLSFYYLPGGKGDPPSKNDSLILEFSADSGKTYQPQWIARNFKDTLSIEQFISASNSWSNSKFDFNTKKFRLAMIPIVQSKYKNDGFMFRFRNTASITGKEFGKIGMSDLWHIDYVYLDRGRTALDTIYHDLTFYKPLPTQLTPYTSVPFNHYISGSSISKPIMEFHIRNNNHQTLIAQKYFRITELKNGLPTSNTLLFSLNKEGVDPFAFYTAYIEPDKYITNETSNITFETRAYFEYIKDDEWKGNNEIKHIQEFKDYFSYDDGTSEAGYGIYASTGIVAYKFSVNETDTLTGVRIYFNPSVNDVSKSYYFKLAVWADNKGKPGTRLYVDENNESRKPDKLGDFNEFTLKNPIIINEDEDFYVGWYQLGEYFLNVGYDLNSNGRDFLFYNYSGVWQRSGSENGEVVTGALMMRPVFGNATIEDTSSNNLKSKPITISPNPASDGYITLQNLNKNKIVKTVLFINPIGQVIKEKNYITNEKLDITGIPKGLYVVKVIYTDGASESNKLLKK